MVLTELRAKTRSLHDALEGRLNILDPGLSTERYFHLLGLFYGFYAPLESSIEAYGDNPRAWLAGDRRKTPLLKDDLRYCGGTDHLPVCGQLPDVAQPASQLGCMYVLEGATLGGQVVLRHVRPRLGLNGKGTSFFASYGERVGPMWRGFCDYLNGREFSAEDRDAVVASACATFDSLQKWLGANGGF
jgi:heme oxygenase